MPGNRPAVADGDIAASPVGRFAPPGAAARPDLRQVRETAAPEAAPSSNPDGQARRTRAASGRQAPAGRRRRTALLRLISPVTALVIWQLVSELGLVSAQKLPPPTQVWSTAATLVTSGSPAFGTLQGALAVSLERVAVGFAVGATIGLLLALISGLSRIGENAVDPLMQMLRTLPLFGLIPVFIVWFGIGEGPKIILIAIGAAIPLYLNAFAGIRNVDAKLGELAQVLHLRRRELITQIVLPGAMPQILVGLRQSLGVAWLALVVAEQINANAGLGFMISQATQFLRNDVIIVALLVYCVLGLITDWLVRMLERKALSWRRSFVAA
jgi:sulfonate transport system permease protein